MQINGNQSVLGKGIPKNVKESDLKTERKTTDEGKRKIQVDRNTWILTSCETDEEAMEKYSRRYSGR